MIDMDQDVIAEIELRKTENRISELEIKVGLLEKNNQQLAKAIASLLEKNNDFTLTPEQLKKEVDYFNSIHPNPQWTVLKCKTKEELEEAKDD